METKQEASILKAAARVLELSTQVSALDQKHREAFDAEMRLAEQLRTIVTKLKQAKDDLCLIITCQEK